MPCKFDWRLLTAFTYNHNLFLIPSDFVKEFVWPQSTKLTSLIKKKKRRKKKKKKSNSSVEKFDHVTGFETCQKCHEFGFLQLLKQTVR